MLPLAQQWPQQHTAHMKQYPASTSMHTGLPMQSMHNHNSMMMPPHTMPQSEPQHSMQPPQMYQHNYSHPKYANAPTVPEIEVSASDVGIAFVQHYFRIMKLKPVELIKFYADSSCVSRLTMSSDGSIDVQQGEGLQQIAEVLHNEHASGNSLDFAVLSIINAQYSVDGGVFVYLTGKLGYMNDTFREFTMSVLLSRVQSQPLGYYIINDIFFLNPPVTGMKLDLTDIPGRSNTYSANNRGLTNNQAQIPTESSSRTHSEISTQTSRDVKQVVKKNVTSHADQKHAVSTQTPTPAETNIDHQTATMSHQEFSSEVDTAQTAAHPVSQSVDSKTTDTQICTEKNITKQANASEVVQAPKIPTQSSTAVEKDPIEMTKENNDVVIESESEMNDSYAPTKQTMPASEKLQHSDKQAKNVAPEQPKAKLVQEMTEKHQTDRTQAEAGEKSTAPTIAQKIQHPTVNPEEYAKNSYAGALFTGMVKAPCRMGYSIPGPEVAKQTSDGGANKSVKAGQPTRTKTLFVAHLPSNIHDDKIKKAVADQLKGQATEGHIVKIERVPNCAHGFIELDTEMCAQILVEQGLHLQGSRIQLDFAHSGRNRMNRQQGIRRQNDENIYDQKTTREYGSTTKLYTDKDWTHRNAKPRFKKGSPTLGESRMKHNVTSSRPKKLDSTVAQSYAPPVK